MIAARFKILLCATLATGIAIAAPGSESDFHSRIAALYSFEPAKLNSADMNAKSQQLDLFWSGAKADPDHVLPLLRKELADPTESAFFYYDGSKLLLSLSKEKADRELALRSIPKADLAGIERTDYLRTVQWFASNGFDTREAAFKILLFPDFKAFIPQHALTLGQDYSLVYMLFPMDESVFARDLDSRLQVEHNVQAQKSLLLALWFVATPEADAAIRKFASGAANPQEARSYAIELLGRKIMALATISLSSGQSLREERRDRIKRPISDEALLEFEHLTYKLRAKQ